MGHALRLLVSREHQLDGTIEMDEFYIGAGPRKGADYPRLERGRKGQPRTTKTPVLAVVKGPAEIIAASRIDTDLCAAQKRNLDRTILSCAR